jgi:hypothetical protein
MNPLAIGIVAATLFGVYKNWGAVKAKLPAKKVAPTVTAAKSTIASSVQKSTIQVTKPVVSPPKPAPFTYVAPPVQSTAPAQVVTATTGPNPSAMADTTSSVDQPAITEGGAGLTTAEGNITSPDELPPADDTPL